MAQESKENNATVPYKNETSLSDDWKKFKSSVKKNAATAKEKFTERTKMDGLIKQARISLEAFLNPKLAIEKQIPIDLLKKCKGIVFLTAAKASLGVGGSLGTGIVMKHNNAYGWSMPCVCKK